MIKLEDGAQITLMNQSPKRVNFHLYKSKNDIIKRVPCEDDCLYCKSISVICDISDSDNIIRALQPREKWLFKAHLGSQQCDEIEVTKSIYKAWLKYQAWESGERNKRHLVKVGLEVVVKDIKGFPSYDCSNFVTYDNKYKIPIGYINRLNDCEQINIQEAVLWKPSDFYNPAITC